jgi:hypothetical protein
LSRGEMNAVIAKHLRLILLQIGPFHAIRLHATANALRRVRRFRGGSWRCRS